MGKKVLKPNYRRVVLNVPMDLDNAFHDLAEKRGIAKSQMIMFAMSFYRDYNKTLDMLPSIVDAINKSDKQSKSKK